MIDPNEKKLILIVDPVQEVLTDGLIQKGFNVLYLPDADRTEIIKNLPEAFGLVIRTKTFVDAQLLEHANRLRVIARAGAGLDNIDLETAEAKGITCINAGEANAVAVGEHALGMLLMVMNNLSRAHSEVKQHVWKREANRGVELSGKTVAIIGYGNTGKAVARRLLGFNVRVLVYDKYLQKYAEPGIEESNWETICREADVLSFHVPLNAETHYYFDEALLEKFAKPLFLLNLSRGGVVKTQALIQGLKLGKIAGAALDVLENEAVEKLTGEDLTDFHFLVSQPNVVITPHIGGWTVESYRKISEVLLGKLLTFSPEI